MKISELLSPAGTKEAFYAAISNGADAIYLGLDKFNARAYAENFNLDNLKEYVDFAHLRNVKIYVTMNTVLYDYELLEAYRTVDKLAEIGVDALIVQDLALFNYITSTYKSIEAHASTQMGIDDVNGAKIVKELGGTRVVVARETPIKVIRDIKKQTNIEVEAFIHGALCVAYSGNCLMSSMIGDRSGNRGRCAGCCRQVYSLIDNKNNNVIKTGYLLSMKDLNLSDEIKNMNFVDSLKIEGRMKELEYVASVTRSYRKILDNDDFNKKDLEKVFNRTYTKGFIFGETSENITNIERPNNYGYEIGKIVKINKNKIRIKLTDELNKGDQIRIESKNPFEEISVPITRQFDASFNVVDKNNKIAIIYTDKKVFLGARIFKTKDINFYKEINETLKAKEYKKLEICMAFEAKLNKEPLLMIEYSGIKSYAKSKILVTNAISSPTSKTNIINQLNKLNDTPYEIKDIKINIDENIFIPLKEINELRRKAIESLNEIRLNHKVSLKNKREILPLDAPISAPYLTVEVNNEEQYNVAKELGIEHIYFKNIVRRNNEHYVDETNEILVGGLGALSYYKNKNVNLVTDYSLNVTNYETAAILSSLGANRITLSLEINKEKINTLITNYNNAYHKNPNLELIIYGSSILMHTKYCPLKRLGMCGMCKKGSYSLKDCFASFPILFNDDCTIKILNSKITNNIDEIDKIKGVNAFRLVFTTESKEETSRIIKLAKSKLEGNLESPSFDSSNNTHGHFFKAPL